jgi:ketosteroid isomerase-like protein
MSQENVEIVRRAYAALTCGDVDVLRDLMPPDFVVDFSRRLVDPFVLRDRDEVLAFFVSELREPWDGWPSWQLEELIDKGDKVFAVIRFAARGRASGVEVDTQVANVWTFRDGKAVEFTYFGEDRTEALEAAELAE